MHRKRSDAIRQIPIRDARNRHEMAQIQRRLRKRMRELSGLRNQIQKEQPTCRQSRQRRLRKLQARLSQMALQTS